MNILRLLCSLTLVFNSYGSIICIELIPLPHIYTQLFFKHISLCCLSFKLLSIISGISFSFLCDFSLFLITSSTSCLLLSPHSKNQNQNTKTSSYLIYVRRVLIVIKKIKVEHWTVDNITRNQYCQVLQFPHKFPSESLQNPYAICF